MVAAADGYVRDVMLLTIRAFQPKDAPALRALFFQTIHQVNCQHYSAAQLTAWAPADYDAAVWLARLRALAPFVAWLGNEIVGYADVQVDGYIDHFYCHANYQGLGVGRALMQQILAQAQARQLPLLYSQVSMTAQPFFQHFGFHIVQHQQVAIRGEVLDNALMQKRL